VTLKVGSLVRHKVIRRDDDVNVYRYGIAIKEVENNPFLVDCWKVAWIPTKEHPVGQVGHLYMDHVKKQNLIVLSS